ncbi:MAG: SPFH domain-containing protein [Eubacteriales bacterium]|nr:SPFH domain-containing protein [Eubacteriales bacterium]
MGKKLVLEPIKDENLIVQFAEPVELTKDVYLTVPRQYKAYVYIDEKLELIAKTCVEAKIYELLSKDKSYLKKQIQVAFVNTLFPRILWGVGDVQVKNDKLEQAYRVGANGECVFEVVNDRAFINSFKFGSSITLDDIKKRVSSSLQMTAMDALSSLFAGTEISVFEMTANTEEIRDKIVDKINDENIVKDMGIKVNSLTAKIFIPEEDLLRIKNAIG